MPTDRTRLRGWSHRIAAPCFAAAFIVLVVLARGARLATVVYGAGVTAMLTVSAVYHSGRLADRASRIMRRLDHSAILLAIAGTYTAVTALATTGRTRVLLLAGVWLAAVVGIVLRTFWLDAPRIVVAVLFLVVGWYMLVDMPAYVRGLDAAALWLLGAGGMSYTVGGVIYAVGKPNPWPRTFGFHEIFHLLVVAGAACHYVAVLTLLPA